MEVLNFLRGGGEEEEEGICFVTLKEGAFAYISVHIIET